jgi:hypothetical protein
MCGSSACHATQPFPQNTTPPSRSPLFPSKTSLVPKHHFFPPKHQSVNACVAALHAMPHSPFFEKKSSPLPEHQFYTTVWSFYEEVLFTPRATRAATTTCCDLVSTIQLTCATSVFICCSPGPRALPRLHVVTLSPPSNSHVPPLCSFVVLQGHARCHDYMMKFGKPLLVLGGGGYKIVNVARCWTYETAVLLGECSKCVDTVWVWGGGGAAVRFLGRWRGGAGFLITWSASGTLGQRKDPSKSRQGCTKLSTWLDAGPTRQCCCWVSAFFGGGGVCTLW